MQPNMPHLWSLGLYCNLTNSDFLKYQEVSNLFCTVHTFLGAPGRFPGSLNMFSGPPRTPATFPGQFPGLLLLEILIFNPRLVQCYEGKISILPLKRIQGNEPICPGNVSGVPGGPGILFGDPGNILLDTQKDSTNPENL